MISKLVGLNVAFVGIDKVRAEIGAVAAMQTKVSHAAFKLKQFTSLWTVRSRPIWMRIFAKFSPCWNSDKVSFTCLHRII